MLQSMESTQTHVHWVQFTTIKYVVNIFIGQKLKLFLVKTQYWRYRHIAKKKSTFSKIMWIHSIMKSDEHQKWPKIGPKPYSSYTTLKRFWALFLMHLNLLPFRANLFSNKFIKCFYIWGKKMLMNISCNLWVLTAFVTW